MDLTAAFEGLDDRDRIYVQSRLQGMSKVASCAAAGLQPGSHSKIEDRPEIKRALELARAEMVRHTGITLEKVTEMLLDAYRSAVNATEMVMAARELGKLHDLYPSAKVKIDHTHQLKEVKSESDIRRLTTKELLKLAQMRGADVIDADFTEVTALPAPRTAFDAEKG
jgi:hypothetical protein